MADQERDSTVESVIGRAKEAIGSTTGDGGEGRAPQDETESGEKGEQARENLHENRPA